MPTFRKGDPLSVPSRGASLAGCRSLNLPVRTLSPGHERMRDPSPRRADSYRQYWSEVTMALVRYEPWSVLNQLHGQINRIGRASCRERGQTLVDSGAWT